MKLQLLARTFRILLGAALALSMASAALAANRFSVAAGGNWSSTATWATACGGAGGQSVPVAPDNVTICTGSPVTIDTATAVAATVTVNTGGTLQVTTAGNKLATTGLMDVTGAVKVTNGTIQVGAFGAGATPIAPLILESGSSLTVGGGVLIVTYALSSASLPSAGSFTVNGGTVCLQTNGNGSTGPATALWGAGQAISLQLGSGVNFTMSAGTIYLINGDNSPTFDLDIESTTSTITGGTIQLGDGGNPCGVAASVNNPFGLGNNTNATLNLPNLTMGSSQNVAGTLSSTGPMTINGALTINTGNSLLFSGAGNAVTVSGSVTNNGTYTTNGGNPLSVAGSFTNNGTFNAGTSTVTFAGNTNTTLGGTTATTFNNLTMNKPPVAGVNSTFTINTTPTINGTLTFTQGNIVTGANRVILGTAATIATPSASSYVAGSFQKNYNAGNLSYFAGNDFPVGDATNFTPVNISAGTTTTAGSLTVTTSAAQHPQVGASAINSASDIARYWTFANAGLTVGTAISSTFTFVAGDILPGAATAGFIAERYDQTNWNPTALAAANPLNTQVSNITPLAAGNNDFAIGDPISGFNVVPGAFNVFESSTTAGAILGRIYTKLVGAAITLDVVSVNAGRTGANTAYNTNPITVTLFDSRNNSGTLTAPTDCVSTWTTVISTQSLSPAWTNGRATVTITTPVNAWRDVRVQVTQGVNTGCSTDRFSIRPTAFSSITSNMTNNGTSGAPSLKTGQNFTLSALTGLTGYDNGSGATLANPQLIPLIDNTQIIGSPTAGTIGGTFGAASGGTATGSSFYYNEVGNFGLNNNLATTATNAAIYDNAFTAVDQVSTDCVAGNFSNTLSGGKYGCNFGNAVIAQTTGSSGFGRFIPDNFNVGLNSPQFTTACGSGAFTYVGQPFTYATAPVMTVTARSGTSNGLTNTTTKNYAGAYMKLSDAAGTSLNQAPYTTQAGRYSRFDALGGGITPVLDTSLLPATTADPAIGTFTNGVGTLSFSNGGGLGFARSTSTPSAPYNADIALALNVIDTDSVAFAGNPASFGAATSGNGIAFNSGASFLYGIMKLGNAVGSEKLDLPMMLQTLSWAGTGFLVNAADNCTSISLANVSFPTYYPNLTNVNMPSGNLSGGGAFTAGVGSLTVKKPTSSATGAVDVQIDLAAEAKTWLQLKRSTPPGTYTQNSLGRAAFGLYGSQPSNFIFMRENF
jgi:hypothetical protein